MNVMGMVRRRFKLSFILLFLWLLINGFMGCVIFLDMSFVKDIF